MYKRMISDDNKMIKDDIGFFFSLPVCFYGEQRELMPERQEYAARRNV
jgi:hypothetical protein